MFMGYGQLVTILVGVHILAFVAWLILTLITENKNRKTEKKD